MRLRPLIAMIGLIELFLTCFCVSRQGYASEKPVFDLGGSARFRYELRDNRDFNSSVDDQLDFIGTRIRLDVGFHPDEALEAFIQPQFSGVWGQVESNVTGAGTVTPGAITSGTLQDRELTLHQGFVIWHAADAIDLKIGRQEMAYGEHIVIGNVGFSNVGRSFDALLLRLKLAETTTDIFYSILAEDNGNGSPFADDIKFAGSYSNLMSTDLFEALDAYVLWLKDESAGSPSNFNFVTLGSRLLLNYANWQSRVEAGFQIGSAFGNDLIAYMVDAEQAITLSSLNGLRISLNYNHASGDDASSSTFTRYQQLFPTVHRWLGLMDLFGRQNIQSIVLRLDHHWNEKFYSKLEVHSFWRVRSTDFLYSIATEVPVGGQTNPVLANSKHAGEELDMIIGYHPHPLVTLEALGGLFVPSSYVDTALGSSVSYATYLQASFALD